MRIDDVGFIVAGGCLATAGVGGLGAYIVKPILKSMSPFGVALTCGLTAAIGLGVLCTDMEMGGKFVGLMAAYPVGLMAANLLRFQVRFLDPMVAVCIGGVFITPMVLTALCLSATFAG